MYWLGLLALPAAVRAQFSTTMLRFGCSELTIDRIDPLVEPGQIPSAHVHQIVGGNGFNASMPSTDISALADCTTCTFAQDKSNYWTASVYFRARNGSFKRVPQMVNDVIGDANRGLTVYYTAPGPNTVTAFKPGFRMFSGDVTRRESTGLGSRIQSCFRCYTGPNFQGNTYAPCSDPKLDTESFPTTPCPGGIRSSVIFPICWDGQNLDSPNHIDHLANPTNGPAPFAVVDGTCPDTHPVKIPQVHYEVVWDTRAFNDKNEWPEDGSQPLVLSSGDPTGFGQHGDYVFGWEGDALQHAMDNRCFGPTCNGLTTQDFAVANKCQVPPEVNEDNDGWVDELPGGHMIM
ncbi:uncharacterized protein C8A04DRAFT_16108 [Dichotomopilus funicola]|uniref:DUF1996 domain-containing protein n=1 Tax=Dichotomopilus funicola TaxID=1934379 RepID=A0AAN6UWJ0_9PEZI|nr:hypothetical protein C8A04DRAFT_16108 [Dichotomopilus funicola]